VTEGVPPPDDELLRQLEAELKTLEVSDLLVQTLYTVSSLGYRRLSEEERDLEQARLAIEALRALLPVLEGSAGEELVRDFKQVTANLQLAYADAAKGEA
jgi:predicted nucleic acid-binding protein